MNFKKLIIVGSLAISASVAAGFAIAATYYTDVEYYSDASYSSVVGERITYCRGNAETWGVVTAYKRTVERYNCAYPIP